MELIFLVVIVLIYVPMLVLFIQQQDLKRRITELELRTVASPDVPPPDVARSVALPSASSVASPDVALPSVASPDVAPPSASSVASPDVALPSASSVAPSSVAPPSVALPSVPLPSASSVASPDVALPSALELAIGGKLLNRLGALATIIGLVFLFKWGVDNGWITETVRVITGGVVGLAAVAVGPRLERKGLTIFSQGVVALGVATCYLSVYATFAYYHLVPAPVAYIMMASLAVLALWRSIAHASLFLAMMSGLVGYSSPLVLQTGEMNTGGLFAFLSFISMMLIGTVVGLRRWISLYVTALYATIVWWMLWSVHRPWPVEAAGYISALTGMALFVWGLAIIVQRAPQIMDRVTLVFVVIGLWSLFLQLQLPIEGMSWWGQFGVVVTAFGCIAAQFVYLHRFAEDRVFPSAMGILALLAALVLPLHLDCKEDPTRLVWMIAVVVGALLGTRWDHRGMRRAAEIAFGIQVVAYLMAASTYHLASESTAIANTVCLYGCALSAFAWFFLRDMPRIRQGAVVLASIVVTIQTVLAFDAFGEPSWLQSLAGACTWTVLCATGMIVARRSGLNYADLYMMCGLALGVVIWAMFALFAPSAHDYTGPLNARSITGVLQLLCLCLAWYTIPRPTWKFNDGMIIWSGVFLITFLLATMETWTPQMARVYAASDMYGWDSDIRRDLDNRMQLLLSCVWIGYAAVVIAVGFVRRIKAARIVGIAVLGVAVLKVFLYDLSNLQTPFRIISFIVLGLILFGASYLYARFKDRIIA